GDNAAGAAIRAFLERGYAALLRSGEENLLDNARNHDQPELGTAINWVSNQPSLAAGRQTEAWQWLTRDCKRARQAGNRNHVLRPPSRAELDALGKALSLFIRNPFGAAAEGLPVLPVVPTGRVAVIW